MRGNKQKIYILGGSGFLGSGAVKYFTEHGYNVLSERIDVTDYPALLGSFQKTKPDAVINFAGVRASPTIDWCEEHKQETVAVNVTGAINAALAAISANAYPVYISSGCIYSGGIKYAFTEKDEPNFFGSFYSRMRTVTQKALEELPVLQARIRLPMSTRSNPRNLIDKITSYKKVISIPNSVTLIEDFYPALEILITKKPLGILNLTNNGYITHEEILSVYKEVVDPSHHYELISLQELENTLVKAKRSNCVLSNEKATSLDISMPTLDKGRLHTILTTYKNNLHDTK